MIPIIGLIIVFVMVFGVYAISGGNMEIVLHAIPIEGPMILGGSFGAFMLANSGSIAKTALTQGLGAAFKGSKWSKDDYMEILGLLYVLMKTMRSKGVVAVEAHIENTEDSKIFQHFEAVNKDHHVVDFIADYMRMMTMNFEDANQMEDAMMADIERIHEEEHEPQHALAQMGEGLPAIGIVAAVLGVVKTMGNISAPIEVLGASVGGALVGTFLGIFMSYCVVSPFAQRYAQVLAEEGRIFTVIKNTLISYLHGNAPQIAIEIGRRSTPVHLQPEFLVLEEYLDDVPPDL
jgi:chemotaxis protein MotA